jgi:hypothetical protein
MALWPVGYVVHPDFFMRDTPLSAVHQTTVTENKVTLHFVLVLSADYL